MPHSHSTQPTKKQARIVRRSNETQSEFHERRLAALRSELQPGYAICTECWRIVKLKANGELRAHFHCPNATPTHGTSDFRLCEHGNDLQEAIQKKCGCANKSYHGGYIFKAKRP